MLNVRNTWIPYEAFSLTESSFKMPSGPFLKRIIDQIRNSWIPYGAFSSNRTSFETPNGSLPREDSCSILGIRGFRMRHFRLTESLSRCRNSWIPYEAFLSHRISFEVPNGSLPRKDSCSMSGMHGFRMRVYIRHILRCSLYNEEDEDKISHSTFFFFCLIGSISRCPMGRYVERMGS